MKLYNSFYFDSVVISLSVRTENNLRHNCCSRHLWYARCDKIFVNKRIVSCWNLCLVYGSIVISEGKVRQYCCDFRAGGTNVLDEERIGRSSTQIEEMPSKLTKNCDLSWLKNFLTLEVPLLRILSTKSTLRPDLLSSEGFKKLVQRYKKYLAIMRIELGL